VFKTHIESVEKLQNSEGNNICAKKQSKYKSNQQMLTLIASIAICIETHTPLFE